MANPGFWKSAETIGFACRTVADEAWKVLRWLLAASAAGVGFAQGQAWQLLALSVLFLVMGSIHLSGWLMDFHIRGVTEKGRSSGPVTSVALVAAAFVPSLVISTVICVILVALLLPFASH